MKKHRLLGFSLAAAIALASPAFAQAPAAPASAGLKTTQTPAGPISEVVLKNGLKVLLKEDHSAPVVSWAVAYKVGSRNEPVGATGSAHLLEHMMFKGTKTLGKGQVAQLLGRNGADFNAYTDDDLTCYYETYASDRLEMGLAVESARMRDALILDAERQSEMTVVRNEMERGESSPGSLLHQEITAAAYKSHPYHHPVIGWRSDVENVPTRQLKHYYDSYYQPNNAVAVLVGDFRTADALKLVRHYFEGIPAGKAQPAVYTQEEPQVGERRVTLHRRGETNLVQLAFHIPAIDDADLPALIVTDQILSSGITSRLYQALVEKQLATGAWASAGQQHDPSLFRVGATLRPGVKHEEVEKLLQAELDKLKSAPVTAEELQKAKNQAEADAVYESEGTQGLMFALSRMEAEDRWQREFELLDGMKAVTPADIQRVASKYFNPDNRTVGWYVATPDGPLPPQPKNAGGGKAVQNGAKVVPPKLFAFEQKPLAKHQLIQPVRRVLKNGVTAIVLDNESSRTVAIDGFVRAGALQDPEDKQGLAGTVASMLNKGTRERSKLQLAHDLEFVDASVGFSGGTASTGLSGYSLAKDFDLTSGTLAEELREPTFPADELAKLKTRWIASIQQAEDSPRTRAQRAFSQAIYPKGHPFYELDPEEQIKEIKSLTVADLQAFYRRYYGPNNTTVVVVGKIKPELAFARLEKLFDGWQAAEKTVPSIPDVAAGTPRQVVIPMMDKTNVEIYFGHAGHVKRSSPDYYASSLANYVLGGGTLTSRLGVRLRDEMGLTYGTSSGFSAGVGAGAWKATVTVNPANADTALGEMKKVIGNFLKQGVSAQELAFAKSAFIGSQAEGLATNGGMAGSLSSIEFYCLGLDYWSRYPGIIQGVTLDEVNRAARKLIQPGNANVIIVGPYKKQAK